MRDPDETSGRGAPRDPRAVASATATWDELLAHSRFVRVLARALVRDASLAADVAQATWLAAAEHPPRQEERLAGWLRRVTTNVVRQWGRADAARVRREGVVSKREELPSSETAAEHLETQKRVVQAVQALDEKYRTVVVLRFYENLSPRAIAGRLALPVATVRTRLQRAITMLQCALDVRYEGNRERWLQAVAPLVAGGSLRFAVGGALAVAASLLAAVGVSTFLRANFDSVSVPSLAPVRVAPGDPGPGSAAVHRLLPAVPIALPAEREDERPRNVASGRVVDPMGRPLAGANVALYRDWIDREDGKAPLLIERTGVDGRFAFAGLEPSDHWVFASRPGSTTQSRRVELGFNRRRAVGISLVLHEARRVRGVVQDDLGHGVPHAWVLGFDEARLDDAGNDWDWPETESDAEGRFDLEGLPLSPVFLNAFASGFAPAHVGPFDLADGEREVVIRLAAQPRATLELIGLDSEGRPAKGARLGFTYRGASSAREGDFRTPRRFQRFLIPDDGPLVTDGFPAGSYKFRVWGGGHRFEPSAVEAVLESGRRTTVTFQAEARGATPILRGVLRDVGGEPLGGKSVAAARRDLDRPVVGSTNADGSFEVPSPVPAGSPFVLWLLDEEVALVAPDGMGGILAATADPQTSLGLTADRTASVSGRLRFEDGTPAPGVLVTMEGVASARHGSVAITGSDVDGSFAFLGIAPQPRPVRLAAKWGAASTPFDGSWDLPAGASVEDLEFTIPRLASIRGRVVDAAGNALAGQYVAIRTSYAPMTVTGRDGGFRFERLASGIHELCVSAAAEGWLTGRGTQVAVESGQRLDDVEIVFGQSAAEPGAIRGRVRFGEGTPTGLLERLSVECVNSGCTRVSSGLSSFTFAGLEPGLYTLRARFTVQPLPGGEPVTTVRLSEPAMVEPGGPEIELVLPDPATTATIVVRVAPPPGEALPASIDWMLAVDPDPDSVAGSFGLSSPITNGAFSLHGLPPGRYRIGLGSVDSKPRATRDFTIVGRETVDLGTMTLTPLRRVRGTVTEAHGAPLAGVVISATCDFYGGLGVRESTFSVARDENATLTAEDGRFDLAAGDEELVAWKPGFAPLRFSPRDVADDSSSAPVAVTLLPAGHLEIVGIPREIESEPWSWTLESLEPEEARFGYPSGSGQTTGPPRASVGSYHLPAGRYSVRLWKSTGQGGVVDPPPPMPRASFAWTVEVRAGATTSIDLGREW